MRESSLLTTECGTSLSAPKVANYLARLCKNIPAIPQTRKGVLTRFCRIPDDRPEPLTINVLGVSTKEAEPIYNIYGFGQPNLDYAEDSNSNNVLLFAENTIKVGGVHYYYFHLPDTFVDMQGKREISVTLVYNPPVRRTRMEFMGTRMEFSLYKNTDIKVIADRSSEDVFSEPAIDEESEGNEDSGKIPEIVLYPKTALPQKAFTKRAHDVYTSAQGLT
jgi:hypothetical protein